MRALQWDLRNCWSHDLPLDTPVILSVGSRLDLLRWLDDSHLLAGSSLHPPVCQVLLFTDSSLTGWGAHIGTQVVSGVWSKAERGLHMYVLEMRAVRLTLTHFTRVLENRAGLLATDNTSVRAYVI